MTELVEVFHLIGAGEGTRAIEVIHEEPHLVTAGLPRSDERFLEERRAQIYEGDTALHAAAFTYDVELARALVTAGADVVAANRRGATPLHAATTGEPDTPTWDPAAQSAIVAYLVEAGADPGARASGGVTPLHRAVRNRCSAAVAALLAAGADPSTANDRGSTAFDLAEWTTGRGDTASDAAKAEQRAIVDLLGGR
jgi:hypothetical protein